MYDQSDAEAVHAQFERILQGRREKLPAVAEHLEDARCDILAFTAFPKQVWRHIWSNDPPGAPQPRDPPAHRRRRHLPNREAVIRLVAAVLAEQHDEWIEQRRYLGLEVLVRCRAVLTKREAHDTNEEVPTKPIAGAPSA